MNRRLDFRSIAPTAQRGFSQAGHDALAAGLDPAIKHLIDIRASQMNGCAFCLDLHVEEWRAIGEPEGKLHFVAVWREAGDVFTPRERAALAWAEALTDLMGSGVPDEVYEEVRRHFSDEEVVHLSVAIATINAHNRMNVAFRTPIGRTRAANAARARAAT
jgi:AhpD family alkylhydroperoxidase